MAIDDEYVRVLWRAENLRRCAADLDPALLDRILLHAGADTWLGPTADQFVADVRRARALVADAESAILDTHRRLLAAADRIRQEQIRAGVRS